MAYSYSVESFEGIEAEWEGLLQSSVSNTIFLTPYWQKTWWESVRPDGQELKVLRFRDDDTTIGIAPLVLQDGLITFLGSTDLWDIHDFVVMKGREEDFFQAFAGYLEDEDWTEFKLESILEDSPTLEGMLGLAEAKGYRTEQGLEGELLGVDLPGTWDEYLAGLRKKDRHELRRKLRKLSGEVDFSIQRLEDVDSISESIDEFLSLMAQSREEKSEFLTEERGEFFRDVLLEMAGRGYLSLFFMEVEGVRTAATVCFDYNNVLSLYNSGHNLEYASLGTSFLLKALCIQGAISDGKEYFDMLRGTEQYKYHLGAKGKQLRHISLFR